MSKDFFEKYKDPRWQQKRLEVFEYHGWQCQVCFAETQQLHVHHKRYLKRRDPWDYECEQLAVVCEGCHKNLGEANDLLNEVLSRVPVYDPISAQHLPFLIAGMYGIDIHLQDDAEKLFYETGAKIEGLYLHLWLEGRQKNAKD